MNKRIFSALVAVLIICASALTGFCAPEANGNDVIVKGAVYDEKAGKLAITIANTSTIDVVDSIINVADTEGVITSQGENGNFVQTSAIPAGKEVVVNFDAKIDNYAKRAKDGKLPEINVQVQYIFTKGEIDASAPGFSQNDIKIAEYNNILNERLQPAAL